MRAGFFICLSFLFLACGSNEKKEENTIVGERRQFNEQYRPQYHFTPEKKWMNDPNGLVYQDGKYHLFFQHYPDSIVWGPMHWGHAVSKDLVHWEHKPIALYPDSLGYIFSGSAVIDKENTAGFGKDAMVAVFTYHDPVMEKEGREDYQSQAIAYSLDEGETWTKYPGNPVLPNPGKKDFRDPKVFWDFKTDNWKMILAAGDHLELYASPDLKSWEKVSEFTDPAKDPVGVWECPDLFPLTAQGTEEEKWVLIISHNPGAPNGGSGTRYFIGDYDGKDFTTDQNKNLWLDYGSDNYAGVTFNNTPDGKRILIGWMSNWNYAQDTPTKTWRSAMTLPREIELHKDENVYYLTSFPVENVSAITKEKFTKDSIEQDSVFTQAFDFSQAWLSFEFAENPGNFEVIFANSAGEEFILGYDLEAGIIYTNRQNSGKTGFSDKFAAKVQQMKVPELEQMKFDIFLDRSSVEIFLNHGKYSMTNQFFPSEAFSEVTIKSGSGLKMENFSISKMNSIW